MQASQESALETAGEGEEGEAKKAEEEGEAPAFFALPLPAGPSGEEGKPDAESPDPEEPASNERGRSPLNHRCERRPAGEPVVFIDPRKTRRFHSIIVCCHAVPLLVLLFENAF